MELADITRDVKLCFRIEQYSAIYEDADKVGFSKVRGRGNLFLRSMEELGIMQSSFTGSIYLCNMILRFGGIVIFFKKYNTSHCPDLKLCTPVEF